MDFSENTLKGYYYPENHDEPSDEEGTLAFKVKKAISKRPNSVDGFFEKPKKIKRTTKKSSSVGQAMYDGVSFVTSNEHDSLYASHIIKIEVYEMKKIKDIAPTEQWKHADVRVKYYAQCEEDKHLQSTRDVIYNITKQLASNRDCAKYFIDGDKKQ